MRHLERENRHSLIAKLAVAVTCAITSLDDSSGLDLWQLARASKQQLLPQQHADGIANGMGYIAMSIGSNATLPPSQISLPPLSVVKS